MIKVIANTDPGEIYREIGKASTIEKAEEIRLKARLDLGPTISIQLLNTGELLTDPFGAQQRSQEAEVERAATQGSGFEQFRGIG